MELTKFVTPSDFWLNGVEVEIFWDDAPEATESVQIIVTITLHG